MKRVGLLAMGLCALGLVLYGCASTPDSGPAELRLRYESNAEGTAFVNTAPPDGNTYTAKLVDGATIVEENSFKVIDLGGEPSGNRVTVGWNEVDTIDEYVNVGYVDLGAETGALLQSLPTFSIETYVWVPADYDYLAIGNFFMSFSNGRDPGNSMWFSARHTSFHVILNGIDQFVFNAQDAIVPDDGYGSFIPYSGSWAHLVVVKDSWNTIIYVNGVQVAFGPIQIRSTSYKGNTLTANYLGKSCYPPDYPLHNAKFHSFSIYSGALSAKEVATLYAEGPLAKLNEGN
ncbi:MAG: LamG domain-containing protein [Treponema sp.]|jgi:hypothetical protein|nr:LamG domain-containing protein [Treponema sp.]